MKKVVALLLLLVIEITPAHAYIEHENAILRVMNKAAGKTQTVIVPVGQTRRFEKLDITIRTCKRTDLFEAEEYLAFVEIARPNNERIFSNWMSRNEPGDNPVQDADYDVWLIKCD